MLQRAHHVAHVQMLQCEGRDTCTGMAVWIDAAPQGVSAWARGDSAAAHRQGRRCERDKQGEDERARVA
jgi:hypothetical protein